jgi:hypothetical protein
MTCAVDGRQADDAGVGGVVAGGLTRPSPRGDVHIRGGAASEAAAVRGDAGGTEATKKEDFA